MPLWKTSIKMGHDLSSGTKHQLFSPHQVHTTEFHFLCPQQPQIYPSPARTPTYPVLVLAPECVKSKPCRFSACPPFFLFTFLFIPRISFLAQQHSLVKCKGDETGVKSGAFLRSPHVCNGDASFNAANSGLALSQGPKATTN